MRMKNKTLKMEVEFKFFGFLFSIQNSLFRIRLSKFLLLNLNYGIQVTKFKI